MDSPVIRRLKRPRAIDRVGAGKRGSNMTERAEVGGVLDVRLLRAGGRWPKLRAILDVIKGDEEYSPRIFRNLTTSTTIMAKRSTIRAALDGELMLLRTPVEVSLKPKSLRVLVPAPTGEPQTS